MSYYSMCKVNLEDFSFYDKNKTIEENKDFIKQKRDELKGVIDKAWTAVSIFTAAEASVDTIDSYMDIVNSLKEHYAELERYDVVLFLLDESMDEEDKLSTHERTYWVNHYENASTIHCKETMKDSIRECEKQISQYFDKVLMLMTMNPGVLMQSENEIGKFNNPMDAISYYVGIYREAIEEYYWERTVNILFSTYPCKNEEEEDWDA